MAKTKPKRVHATLGFATLSVHDQIGKANAIVGALTGNKSFPSPNPTLAVLTGAITALANAQALALTKAKGAAEDRNAKRAALLTEFETLRAYVQGVADAANAEDAAALIESAGFGVRKAPNRQPKQNLAVKAGSVSGAAKVVAKASVRASYDWETSPDGKTWTPLPSSTQAHVSVTGLTPGATVFYRFRTVTKAGVSDWSQPVSYFVH